MDNSTTWLGTSSRCAIIGEIGVNHNGSLENAIKLIDVASDAGADAVKFQTFSADKLVTRTAKKADYQIRNDGDGTSQSEMLAKLEFSKDNLIACRKHCEKLGIVFLSTPFDRDAADLLESIGVGGFKVSSGDLTNLPFLRYLAAKKLPIIISTGMANLAETEDAVVAIAEAGDPELAILHCVSDYPAAPHEANLRAMKTIETAFGKTVGWSDHTLGSAVSVGAVAMGAKIIEKHFTLDKAMPGPDHKASLSPEEFRDFVADIRMIEAALGDGVKRMQPSEVPTAEVARRSIVTAHDLPEGHKITESDLDYKRPGTGLPPKMSGYVVGQTTTRPLVKDTLIDLSDVT